VYRSWKSIIEILKFYTVYIGNFSLRKKELKGWIRGGLSGVTGK